MSIISTKSVILTIMGMSIFRCHNTPMVSAKPSNGRQVVLMSMDGFRYDYLQKTHLPHFKKLIDSGVKVPYVNNTFATWTFPCHYTIVTGKYEESHGIVANAMYDPLYDEYFNKGSKDSKWWNGSEPIWVNAVKNGIKTGIFFWPGSESKLHGHAPTEFEPYNKFVPFKDRVDKVVHQWLHQQHFPLNLIYFHEPDATGHMHGPDSPEMIQTLQYMDGILGYFMDELDKTGLTHNVDFILTSDHGMANVDVHNKSIALSDHVNSTLLLEVVISGAVAHLRPQPGKDHELVEALSGIDHIQVYLKEDLPDHFHYKHHRRVMPVVVIAEIGWLILEHDFTFRMDKGDHGYNERNMEMKPILIASGPSFKAGHEHPPVKSVDIYPLLCHLLDIEPQPNNGSFERVRGFLRHDHDPNNSGTSVMTSLYSVLTPLIATCALVTALVKKQ